MKDSIIIKAKRVNHKYKNPVHEPTYNGEQDMNRVQENMSL